jgi:nucleotide-binding universal stress UspA family protein
VADALRHGHLLELDYVGLRVDLHRRFLFLSAIRVWPPFDVKRILGVPPWSREAVVLFKKILIAIDNEPVAAHAADIGAELARLAGAEMAFIHVIDPELVNAADTGIQPAVFAASAKEEARKLIDDFRKRLPPQATALDFVQVGSPLTEIVAAAKDWPADLIVIGSHGRAGIKRALLGSVAEGVMRHAPCPVLVVRAKD